MRTLLTTAALAGSLLGTPCLAATTLSCKVYLAPPNWIEFVYEIDGDTARITSGLSPNAATQSVEETPLLFTLTARDADGVAKTVTTIDRRTGKLTARPASGAKPTSGTCTAVERRF
jgi:hypothetical protein